jgi:hypothetical protein
MVMMLVLLNEGVKCQDVAMVLVEGDNFKKVLRETSGFCKLLDDILF